METYGLSEWNQHSNVKPILVPANLLAAAEIHWIRCAGQAWVRCYLQASKLCRCLFFLLSCYKQSKIIWYLQSVLLHPGQSRSTWCDLLMEKLMLAALLGSNLLCFWVCAVTQLFVLSLAVDGWKILTVCKRVSELCR